MKRILAIIVSLTLLASLAACGAQSETNSETTQAQTQQETEPSAVLAYIVQNAVFLSPDARRLGNDFTGEQLVVLSTCAIARHPEDPARLVVAYRAGN